MPVLEHPEITLALETGYPWPQPRGLCCRLCGCRIRQEDKYYEVFDRVYCPECMEERFARRGE